MAKNKKEEKNDDKEFVGDLISSLNKELGGEITYLVSDGEADVKGFISTGCTDLDFKCANRRGGGVPIGKVISIGGLEGSGKTLLALSICANAQRDKGLGIYLDGEGTFNAEFAKMIGLDVDNNFIYSQPGTIEEVFQTIFATMTKLDAAEKQGREPFKSVVIVVDSVAAFPCAIDLATENPDPQSTMAMKPRVLSKNISTLLRQAGRKNVCLVFLNQLRANIGASFGADKWVEPGGKAIPYASSLRLRVSTLSKLKINDEVVGLRTLVSVRKCRFGPPFRESIFDLYFSRGIDDITCTMETLVLFGELKSGKGGSKGNIYYFPDEDKEETGMSKKEFHVKYKTDAAFKERILGLMEKSLVKHAEVNEDSDIQAESGPGED